MRPKIRRFQDIFATSLCRLGISNAYFEINRNVPKNIRDFSCKCCLCVTKHSLVSKWSFCMNLKCSKFTVPICIKLLQIIYKSIIWQEFSLQFHYFWKYVNIEVLCRTYKHNIFWLVVGQPSGSQDSFLFAIFRLAVCLFKCIIQI